MILYEFLSAVSAILMTFFFLSIQPKSEVEGTILHDL